VRRGKKKKEEKKKSIQKKIKPKKHKERKKSAAARGLYTPSLPPTEMMRWVTAFALFSPALLHASRRKEERKQLASHHTHTLKANFISN
jgi:hypothetical protein